MATIIDDDCNIPQKKCETSNNYDKDDIVEIADKCGIDIYNEKGKLKTRKQLCKEIAENQAAREEPVNIPEYKADIEVPLNIPEYQQVIETIDPLYTEDILENTKKPELLKIAEELGIKKWKNKGIKSHNRRSIIEAILAAIAVEATLPYPLPEPTIIIVEDDPPNDTPLEVIEIPDKKTLNKKTIQVLLKEAGEYGITKWKGKNIKNPKYNKKADIIDAIIDYFETNVTPIVVPSPPRTPIRIPSAIQSRVPSPKNIQELIKQKRQELLQVLKFKEQEQCNPLKETYCSDDNVCDIGKTPNVCISKEEALYRENKGLAEVFDINDKNLIGSKKQKSDLFREIFGGVEESKEPNVDFVFEEEIPIKSAMCKVCTYVNNPDTIECIVCNSDLTEEDINNIVLPEDTYVMERDIIPEGTKITELENIEDILNQIQKTEDTKINLEGLDEAKKKVLYCLGLLN